jgi:protein TonB
MMVSVIDAPAPQQASPQTPPRPQPPTPAAAPPVEPPPEPEPQVQADPTPEPPPVEHPSALAPVIKPHPKPRPKPHPVRHPAPASPAVATPPAPEPPAADATEGRQQASQAPRQDQPTLVTNIEYDGQRPVPVYPRLSRLHNETGRVVVLVRIGAQGKVEDARIDKSSGYARLDDAALEAARRARFKPFTRNGVAMPALAKLPYDFQMKD